MKRFVFSMQKVLELREFEEKQAETELGKARSEETRIQNLLNAVAEQRAAAAHIADTSKDFFDISSADHYYEFLDNQKEQLLQQLTEAKLVSEEKRKLLMEAMQKRSVLQHLRERKLADYKKEAAREEEKVTDDVVSARFGRGSV